jgi:hypothetical protein
VGYTNDPVNRIRKHNGEIKGGAKRTTTIADQSNNNNFWEYLAIILCSGFDQYEKGSSRTALSFEWHLKHPKPYGKFKGLGGRLRAIQSCMLHPKFQGMSFSVHVNEPYSLANLSKIPDEWICHKNSSEMLHHICNSEHTKSNTQDMK